MPWSSTTRSTPRPSGVGQFDQVLQGTAEAVGLGHDELIASAVRGQQRLVQFGAAGELAGGFVDEDRFAAGGGECVVLCFGMLAAGGDPSVADSHGLQRVADPDSETLKRTRHVRRSGPGRTFSGTYRLVNERNRTLQSETSRDDLPCRLRALWAVETYRSITEVVPVFVDLRLVVPDPGSAGW
jgi:hypothetical protein